MASGSAACIKIMTRQQLIQQIREKQSFLCVGLDPDIKKIPQCVIDECKAELAADDEEYDESLAIIPSSTSTSSTLLHLTA